MGEEVRSQERLDQILDFHKGEPVGRGYSEIIVHRDRYKPFIKDVLSEGFRISAISWWEYRDSVEKSEYGMGARPSWFYPGLFSELCIRDDDIKVQNDAEEAILEITAIIENKEIHFPDGDMVTFKEHSFLTPGFWLEVPPNWKNKYFRADNRWRTLLRRLCFKTKNLLSKSR